MIRQQYTIQHLIDISYCGTILILHSILTLWLQKNWLNLLYNSFPTVVRPLLFLLLKYCAEISNDHLVKEVLKKVVLGTEHTLMQRVYMTQDVQYTKISISQIIHCIKSYEISLQAIFLIKSTETVQITPLRRTPASSP